jgi:hypothetical protein
MRRRRRRRHTSHAHPACDAYAADPLRRSILQRTRRRFRHRRDGLQVRVLQRLRLREVQYVRCRLRQLPDVLELQLRQQLQQPRVFRNDGVAARHASLHDASCVQRQRCEKQRPPLQGQVRRRRRQRHDSGDTIAAGGRRHGSAGDADVHDRPRDVGDDVHLQLL